MLSGGSCQYGTKGTPLLSYARTPQIRSSQPGTRWRSAAFLAGLEGRCCYCSGMLLFKRVSVNIPLAKAAERRPTRNALTYVLSQRTSVYLRQNVL